MPDSPLPPSASWAHQSTANALLNRIHHYACQAATWDQVALLYAELELPQHTSPPALTHLSSLPQGRLGSVSQAQVIFDQPVVMANAPPLPKLVVKNPVRFLVAPIGARNGNN
ncbi:hypothetical protein H4R35_004094 [Dimargaris xerosporica]|nr:hypothetical protein H4R35_004094 [Dimargaris xerosporica]